MKRGIFVVWCLWLSKKHITNRWAKERGSVSPLLVLNEINSRQKTIHQLMHVCYPVFLCMWCKEDGASLLSSSHHKVNGRRCRGSQCQLSQHPSDEKIGFFSSFQSQQRRRGKTWKGSKCEGYERVSVCEKQWQFNEKMDRIWMISAVALCFSVRRRRGEEKVKRRKGNCIQQQFCTPEKEKVCGDEEGSKTNECLFLSLSCVSLAGLRDDSHRHRMRRVETVSSVNTPVCVHVYVYVILVWKSCSEFTGWRVEVKLTLVYQKLSRWCTNFSLSEGREREKAMTVNSSDNKTKGKQVRVLLPFKGKETKKKKIIPFRVQLHGPSSLEKRCAPGSSLHKHADLITLVFPSSFSSSLYVWFFVACNSYLCKSESLSGGFLAQQEARMKREKITDQKKEGKEETVKFFPLFCPPLVNFWPSFLFWS